MSKKKVTVAEYHNTFKRDLKTLESAVGPKYAIWKGKQRFIYCPKCEDYTPEDDFNDSSETGTGKSLWCKKHEVKIETIKGGFEKHIKLTQEICMKMPEVNSRGCEAARNKINQIEEMFKEKIDDILTPFNTSFQGLFVEKEGILYNF